MTETERRGENRSGKRKKRSERWKGERESQTQHSHRITTKHSQDTHNAPLQLSWVN